MSLSANDAPPATGWRDDYVARLEALALLQSLNADLLSHDSATLTLDRWCGSHRPATPAKIVAERIRNVRQTADGAAARAAARERDASRCGIGAFIFVAAIRFFARRTTGTSASRLTAEMNQALDTTDIAFGRAVQALHFQRRDAVRGAALAPAARKGGRWPARRRGVARATRSALQIPHEVLQHRAGCSSLPDGTPFSVVVETYTAGQSWAFRSRSVPVRAATRPLSRRSPTLRACRPCIRPTCTHSGAT